MKRFWKLSARNVAIGLTGWFIATNGLVALAHETNWWPVKVTLFICLSLLPGAAVLRMMRLTLRMAESLLYSFGLSVLVLMVSGLISNQLLYAAGFVHPLAIEGALGTWDVVTALLIGTGIVINRRPLYIKKRNLLYGSKMAWLFAGLTLLLPLGAAAGAFRLNNGGDGLFAELTLGYGVGLIIYASLFRRRLPSDLLAWFIFILSLTILLMTSLRGWDIVGHDIEREFRVYTLTNLQAHWDIALDRDPYNACLSITILPEMFSHLLNVSGLIVFKVILQIIFAACPVAIYVLLRRHISKLGALTGSLLFISYPTFINDSAMLTRQGVAYLFFTLALLVLVSAGQRKQYKLLFLLYALGAILSHYSTAYMFTALFAAAVVCKYLIAGWQAHRHWPLRLRMRRTVLSPFVAITLFLMTFMWYTSLTATSGGLATTLHTSFANISTLFSADNKSHDTSSALLFAGGKTQADLYNSYLQSSYHSHPSEEGSEARYIPELTSDNLLLTQFGKRADRIGIHASLITALRQNFAKFLQLLALLSVLYLVYRLLRQKNHILEPDFICLNMAGLLLLALMVMLPVLSLNYGMLRAFQQALIFLILPIMLLLVRIVQRFQPWIHTTLATAGTAFLFLLFTGIFAQVLGGVSPSLTMNNGGLYYSLYESSAADQQSFAWLKENVPKKSGAQAANFNRALMHDPYYPFSKSQVLPSQVTPNSYVYLDDAQIHAKKLYTYYQSSPLIMTFPLEYYDNTRDQIYSTASTRIYK